MLLIWKWLFWSSAGWIRHDCWRCMRNDVMPSSIEPGDRKWRNAFPLPWPWLMIWNDLEWYPQQKIENGVCSRKQYYETTHVSWNMLKSGSAWHRPLRAAPLQWGAHNNATSFVGGKRCALRGSLAQIGAVINIYILLHIASFISYWAAFGALTLDHTNQKWIKESSWWKYIARESAKVPRNCQEFLCSPGMRWTSSSVISPIFLCGQLSPHHGVTGKESKGLCSFWCHPPDGCWTAKEPHSTPQDVRKYNGNLHFSRDPETSLCQALTSMGWINYWHPWDGSTTQKSSSKMEPFWAKRW